MESDGLLTPPAVQTNILEKGRRKTDPVFSIILLVVILIWIAIGIYAYVTGDSSKILPLVVVERILKAFSFPRIIFIIGFALLTPLFALLYLTLLYLIPNVSYATLGIIWIPIAAGITFVALEPGFISIFALISAVCSVGLTFVLINSEWFYLTEALIKETCRVLKSNIKLVIFAVIWYKLCLIVIAYGASVHMYLSTILELDGLTWPVYVRILIALNFFASNWIPWVMLNFGQMVVSGTFATWFLTTNKDAIPTNTVTRFFKITIKNHVGTVANGAWLFGAVDSLFAIFRTLNDKFRQATRKKKLVLLFVSNIFDMVVLRFTMCNAINMCALHGQDYKKSVDYAVGHLAKHPRRCLMISKMSEWIFLLGILFISLLMGLSTSGYFVPFIGPADVNILITSVGGLSLIFILPTFVLITTGLNTLLLCVLEDIAINDGSEGKPYHMNPDIKSALDKTNPPNWYKDFIDRDGLSKSKVEQI